MREPQIPAHRLDLVARLVDRVLDVPFASPGGVELKADLFLPRDLGRAAPVIIWLHGGAWKFGDRRLGPNFERFFARRGFAMVSVDYRLSQQARFPAQVEDVKTAIRWVRSVAPRYGFDSGAIGLWGSSAGAHLATVAALSGPGVFEGSSSLPEQSSHVQAVVAGYGPTDFLRMDEQRECDPPSHQDLKSISLTSPPRSSDADSPESLLVGGPIAEHVEIVRRASPITYATGTAPPTLLAHGLCDVVIPWQQSQLLYDAMAKSGANVSLVLLDRLGHGFLDRTELDEGRTWTWQIRTAAAGRDSVSSGNGSVFGLIEAFFRAHLENASSGGPLQPESRAEDFL